MSKKSALALLVACCAALPTSAWATSEADCAAQWKSADGNNDGTLVGPEADRYLAYYRVRAQVTPVDGRLSRQDFMKACENDVFMAKAPDPGAPLNRHRPIDPVERRAYYMSGGWRRFDPSAAPYRPTQAEIDRLRTPYQN